MTITALATNLIANRQIHAKYKALRKINLIRRLKTSLIALLLVGNCASYAMADDSFALAPGAHDDLVIFGPKGEQVAELSIPTISQAVTVGSTSFQISYGRDANNYVTAILAPSSAQPQSLHFTVLNKTVEADKQAVVTLTFPDSRHVIVDPGYIGTVTVNSHTLRHRDLADSVPVAPAPAPVRTAPAPAPAPVIQHAVADVQLHDIPAPASQSAPAPPVQHPAPTISHQAETATSSSEPPPPSDGPTANEQTGSIQPSPLAPPPLLGSMFSQPPNSVPKGTAGLTPPPAKKLYWAEPITPPSGTAPTVGIDEMKLVAVHGPVTLTLPNGEKKSAADGMLIPSGTSIATTENSSAAVFMGGVDSARLLPNTQAKVSQNLNGSTRKTNIDVKSGTIFSRVGHRPGEKQDYEVRTPEGVAAARGTSFAVSVTTASGHEVTVCATQDGVVTLTDSSNGHVITVTPMNSGQISIGSIPGLPINTLRDIFVAFLSALQQFNTNMQAIANMTNPTAADLAYYNSNYGFDSNTQFYDVNADQLSYLFLTPSGSLLFDQDNSINYVVPGARRALNQLFQPFGTVPVTPY
jgi:hypothetical protein